RYRNAISRPLFHRYGQRRIKKQVFRSNPLSNATEMQPATPTRDELIGRAAQIRPILEANAEETDNLRHLPESNIQALKQMGLCRLMTPKHFGGYGADIHTYIAVIEELGKGCGSTAWTASLINVC